MSLVDRLQPSIVMTAPLVRREPKPVLPWRNASPDDLPALADLLVVAYARTVVDPGQTAADVLRYLTNFTAGDAFGPMLWDCSFVALDDETPVATVLTCEENGKALLQDVYTHPEWQRQGLATSLVALAMNGLLERRYVFARLRVAAANERARRVYERLGFAEE